MPNVDQASHRPLSSRARRVLAFLAVAEPAQLASIQWLDIAKIKGCGRKTIREIAIWGGPLAEHIADRMSEHERAYWTASLAASVRS